MQIAVGVLIFQSRILFDFFLQLSAVCLNYRPDKVGNFVPQFIASGLFRPIASSVTGLEL